MQSRNSTSSFIAEPEEVESGSNSVFLNMSLIIRVNITFDAVSFSSFATKPTNFLSS